jgi:hypothetical protein
MLLAFLLQELYRSVQEVPGNGLPTATGGLIIRKPCQTDATYGFGSEPVNIDYDYVTCCFLLSTTAPVARPRCYIRSRHCSCHKSELEHCSMIDLPDFNQLDLGSYQHQHEPTLKATSCRSLCSG